MSNETKYYFPWVRKGLKDGIKEEDTLGKSDTGSLNEQRHSILVTADYKITQPPKDGVTTDPLQVSLSKQIQIIGPGDIIKVNSNAVIRTNPVRRSTGFPIEFYPYIEFWEPDFPWRYTPAIPNDNKLRPWLALLVCKISDCTIKSSGGNYKVMFNISGEEQYEQIFPDPTGTWKMAHTQGAEVPDDKNPKITQIAPDFSRLIAIRRTPEENEEGDKYYLEEDTEYVAMLVPAFETGRLRGLGYGNEELEKVAAQMPAWENSFRAQQSNHKQPFDFPVYYQWYFKTGSDSFEKLAKALKLADEDKLKADIKIDVSRMGNGFDYNTPPHNNIQDGQKRRNVIGMPAATKTVGYETIAFPSSSPDADNAEKALYDNLKYLVDNNPVFTENYAEINNLPYDEVGNDDPWVTPPVYGAKHIMATGINDAGTPQWLPQLNLDVHYRAVAGLGKRTVQIHQEEFVNRAWKQVEAVNALNHELYQRLLSVNASDALKEKVIPDVPDKEEKSAQYIARLMRYLGSMKNANFNDSLSLSDILKRNNIPAAFASASFQHLTDDLSKYVEDLNGTTLMGNIAENQIISNMPALDHSLTNIRQLYKFNFPFTFVAAVSDGNDKKVTNGVNSKIWEKISQFFTVVRKTDTQNAIKKLYTFVPKSISHEKNHENNPNYIFTSNYKLKRYYEFFRDITNNWSAEDYDNVHKYPPTDAEKKQGYDAYAKKPLGKMRKVEQRNYFTKTRLAMESIYMNIYDRMGKFLEEEKDKYRGFGYTKDRVTYSNEKSGTDIGINNYYDNDEKLRARPRASLGDNASNTSYDYKMERYHYQKQYNNLPPNVIVLSDNEFNEIFSLNRSWKTIIRVGGKDGYYFVPMRVVKSPVFNRDAVRSFVRLPNSFSNSADSYLEAQIVSSYDSYRYNEEDIKCVETVYFKYDNNALTAVTNAQFAKPDYPGKYRGLPVLIDTAPKATNNLFTGNFGKYCYSPAQLYHPLTWKIFELWKRYPSKDMMYTTLINYIQPVFGISPVLGSNEDIMLYKPQYAYSCDGCGKKGNCNLTSNTQQCWNERLKLYKEYQRNISKYLFEQPDYIELDVDEFKNLGGKVIHYDTAHDFAYYYLLHLRDSTQEEQSKFCLFQPWYDLFNHSKELDDKINRLQWERQPLRKPNKEDITQWEKGTDHSELYERMKDVAEAYYEEFFGKDGKDLVEGYIEDLLHTRYPAMAYPIFPEPAYYYLKMFSGKFFIPSIDEIPDDSVALFLSNEEFVETYLCGMNTEMGRELLWREYPTDQRGSYFRKFWDLDTTKEDMHKNNFFDVKPLHTWTDKLGKHHAESKSGLLFFAIKGKLIQKFPNTQVILHKATGRYDAANKTISDVKFPDNVLDEEYIIRPVTKAYIREDILLLGFKKGFAEVLGNPEKGDFGYFLTFVEDVHDLNFKYYPEENENNAADVANKLINKPTLFGKHLSHFTKKI